MSTKSQKLKYPIEVFWNDEDEAYIAVVPDLPGCSAVGDSEEEALNEAQDAMAAWLQAAKKAGREIPSPSIDNNFSGKFVIRVPKRLHASLTRKAKMQGVSLNQYVLFLLSERQMEHRLSA